MKTLKLFNGRFGRNGHAYIAAYSRADAARMLTELCGGKVSAWVFEIAIYWSEGVWGTRMAGVPLERGIWVAKGLFDKPVRKETQVTAG